MKTGAEDAAAALCAVRDLRDGRRQDGLHSVLARGRAELRGGQHVAHQLARKVVAVAVKEAVRRTPPVALQQQGFRGWSSGFRVKEAVRWTPPGTRQQQQKKKGQC